MLTVVSLPGHVSCTKPGGVAEPVVVVLLAALMLLAVHRSSPPGSP